MSFGTGPFGIGPLGLPVVTWASENGGQVANSRKIDGSGRYTQTPDGTGAFVGMSDVQQRVLLLICYRVKVPNKITEGFVEDITNQVIVALDPLTRGSNPKIEVLQIAVTDSGTNVSMVDVKYKDLTGGGVQTAQAKIR